MSTIETQSNTAGAVFHRFQFRRGLAFGVIIFTALLAFEIFNYSTTDYALGDLLGSLNFMGLSWATILAIAFCGIDFAGIARLFTPGEGANETREVWYLFGAWLLAATMNAMLTWWGVSLAVLNHNTLGNTVISRETLVRVVPIFVAVMVWLIRVLIIGTFSVAGDRLFGQVEQRTRLQPRPAARTIASPPPARPTGNPAPAPMRMSATPNSGAFHPTSKTQTPEAAYGHQELTYTPVQMSATSSNSRSTSAETAGARPGYPKGR